MAELEQCKYCLRYYDPRGMLAHVHFMHSGYVRREFALNSGMWMFMIAAGHGDGLPPDLSRNVLPAKASAGSPLPMLAPVEKRCFWPLPKESPRKRRQLLVSI